MVKGQQPNFFDCGTMLVKVSKEVDEEEANHPTLPMDRTANWCSHGGWFTLAHMEHCFEV
jgi:hypothetical protein